MRRERMHTIPLPDDAFARLNTDNPNFGTILGFKLRFSKLLLSITELNREGESNRSCPLLALFTLNGKSPKGVSGRADYRSFNHTSGSLHPFIPHGRGCLQSNIVREYYRNRNSSSSMLMNFKVKVEYTSVSPIIHASKTIAYRQDIVFSWSASKCQCSIPLRDLLGSVSASGSTTPSSFTRIENMLLDGAGSMSIGYFNAQYLLG